MTRTVGANIKEVQTLARHANPSLTMRVYAKVREQGLSNSVERVRDALVKANVAPRESAHA